LSRTAVKEMIILCVYIEVADLLTLNHESLWRVCELFRIDRTTEQNENIGV